MAVILNITNTKQWICDEDAPLSEDICIEIAELEDELIYNDGVVEAADASVDGFNKLLDFIERYQRKLDQ